MLNRRRLLLGGTAFAAAAAITSVSFPALAQSRAADSPAGEEVVAWLKANAMPLASAEPGSGFGDLAALRDVIGDARIVSLGKATHGTREFFQLKHRLIEYCVAELGFTTAIASVRDVETLKPLEVLARDVLPHAERL